MEFCNNALFDRVGRRLALPALLLLLAPAPVEAAICNWIGAGTSGNYATTTSWSCGRAPGSADSATIAGANGLVVSNGNNTTLIGLAIALNNTLSMTGNSRLSITGGSLALNGTLNIGTGYLRNNGAANSTLVIDTADAATGTGLINLGGGNIFRGNKGSLSSRITISGGGNIGNNASAITNAGTISATSALTIDPNGGSDGVTSSAANGLAGTDNATFFNSGSVIAQTGSITAAGGRYQNSATGLFAARNGTTFSMASNGTTANAAALSNLSAAGALLLGSYEATGNGSTLVLRGPATTPGIVTIGAGSSFGTANTNVILSGAGSVVSAGASNTATTATIDNTLVTIAGSGVLQVLNGRAFNAGARAITNNGTLVLGGTAANADGSFTAGSISNGGQITGHGSVSVVINNAIAGSLVRASNGTLALRGLTGNGDATADASATLSLTAATAPSTVRNLANNGSVALGSQSVTVSGDYTNAGFGSGNAFNARANVSGTGLINALSATQTLSAPGLSGTTLSLPAARVGGTAQRLLTITNAGTLTTLRGAIQNNAAPLVAIGTPNFAIAAKGGTATSTISINTGAAGSYSQVITIANNFANVGTASLTVKANVYAPAVATLGSNSVNFGTVRGGSAPVVKSVSLANTAVGTPADTLLTTAGTAPPRVTVTAPGAIAAGLSDVISFTLATSSPGIVGPSATIGFASHNAELADLTLLSQTVNLSGTVTQTAIASLFKVSGNASLTANGSNYLLDLGSRANNAGLISINLGVLNNIPASGYGETLVASFSGGNGNGFSFASNDVSSIAAGSSVLGNLLSFNTSGLSPGLYNISLYLDSFSRFPGLTDTAPQRQVVDVQLSLFAPFPEPATWAEMLAGFGLIGLALRRRAPIPMVCA